MEELLYCKIFKIKFEDKFFTLKIYEKYLTFPNVYKSKSMLIKSFNNPFLLKLKYGFESKYKLYFIFEYIHDANNLLVREWNYNLNEFHKNQLNI